MNAEQKFEKLGYDRFKSPFRDWIEYGIVRNYPTCSRFKFDTAYYQFSCGLETMNWGEIQATILQMKELGWIDEILGEEQ